MRLKTTLLESINHSHVQSRASQLEKQVAALQARVAEFEKQTTTGGSMQTPSVGRVVHYQAYGTPGGEFKSEPKAAIIAAVVPDNPQGLCSIVVFNPSGLFFNTVEYSEEPKPGYWNWPPVVPPKVAP